jgi:fatty-acyl-CoA synthase
VSHDTSHASGHAKKGLGFAHFAFFVALLAGLYLLGVMLATRMGYVSQDFGFKTLTLNVGPRVAVAALAISGLSLLISLFLAPVRCGLWALCAVLLSGGLMGGFFLYQKALHMFPPIHDVATDWDRPPDFSDKLMAERGPEAAPVEELPRVPRNESFEWGGKTVGDINQLSCPAAKTVLNKAITENQVAQILRDAHYSLQPIAQGRVEGTYRDNFYGFLSDVVVRVEPGRVDIRSVNRYDMPDLGGNCRRVTAIVQKLRALQ